MVTGMPRLTPTTKVSPKASAAPNTDTAVTRTATVELAARLGLASAATLPLLLQVSTVSWKLYVR
jgi:hypothetical protein